MNFCEKIFDLDKVQCFLFTCRFCGIKYHKMTFLKLSKSLFQLSYFHYFGFVVMFFLEHTAWKQRRARDLASIDLPKSGRSRHILRQHILISVYVSCVYFHSQSKNTLGAVIIYRLGGAEDFRLKC